MDMLYLKIPKERIPVFIGTGGDTKRQVEEGCGVRLDIDSSTGDVTIHNDEAEDAYMGIRARDIVKAVGRGFSPENAMQLLNEDYYLTIIDIHDFVGKKQSHVHRIKARVIGRRGKTRELIQELTETTLSIYGYTVAIIGDVEGVTNAKEAVEMLLSGSEHKTVYRFLERKKQDMKISRMGLDYYEER